LCREGKNRAVHSLPAAFIKICEESERSCHGLWSAQHRLRIIPPSRYKQGAALNEIFMKTKNSIPLIIFMVSQFVTPTDYEQITDT
jgi:hypothetical protein